jgi:hypothetical protein
MIRGVFLPAQLINFAIVPHQFRFVFVGVVSLFWSESFAFHAFAPLLHISLPTGASSLRYVLSLRHISSTAFFPFYKLRPYILTLALSGIRRYIPQRSQCPGASCTCYRGRARQIGIENRRGLGLTKRTSAKRPRCPYNYTL